VRQELDRRLLTEVLGLDSKAMDVTFCATSSVPSHQFTVVCVVRRRLTS